MTYWSRATDVEDYLVNRMAFLADLADFNHFGRGWMRRVIALTRVIDAELAKQARSPDVELVQLFYLGHTYEFRPIRTTLGTTKSGRVKVMARLK